MAVVISDRLLEGSDRLLDAEPDEQLVRLAQSGHEAAFAAIVRRYERELQAQARRLSSDGRGEDAVQQAFLNAFSALQGGGQVHHLRGWLHRILRNEVTRARVPVDAPLDDAAAYGETLEDTVQRRAAAHATLAHLSALPDRQRDALLGTAVLGFPRAHVAHTMGLSEGAVRQLVHRARLRLRQAASAVIPFPLVRLFGAARSGVDAAPDAALGAGAAASGGLAIKVGALVASGVVATGVVVTQTVPSRHHTASPVSGARHHAAPARGAPAHGSAPAASSVAPTDPEMVVNSVRLREHGRSAAREEARSHGGTGRLSGTRSGRHRGRGAGRGRDGGRDDGGTSSGRGDDGAGSDQGGPSGSGSGRQGDPSAASMTGSPGAASTPVATTTDDGISGGDGGGSTESGSGSGGSGGGSGSGGKETSGGSRDVSGSSGSSSS